jgi:questin oxidase-like protein
MTDTLDEALEAISRMAPEFPNGNTNHAPMVAETLDTMGRGESVPAWLEAYRRDLGERPAAGGRLDYDWRESLGKPDLWNAWAGLFREELTEAPWRDVLDAWASRLAPGLSGAATHGLIRTAHAARALGQAETGPRLNELSDALAYWAASYHSFGPAPPPEPRHFSLDEALAMVPHLNPPMGDNIDRTLKGLDGSRDFVTVINYLGTSPDPVRDLSDLTERFAGVYVSNAHDEESVFAVVHALTGPSALRLLSPHVTNSTRELLLLYAWQTVAAIYAVWAKDRTAPKVTEPAVSGDELRDVALANGAPHAIKFVDACLREYELNPQPVYLAAAADAAGRLRG